MTSSHAVAPEHTAVRVALWRALHVEVDPAPHVLEDAVGLKLVAEEGWRQRPDMDPARFRRIRAAIAGRARFIEDLVEARMARTGVEQYVILGAGLDSFAQRRTELARRLRVFEVDQPGPQQWKQQRLVETGFGIPEWLRLVPVDFEAGQSWWSQLVAAGFAETKPAVVVSTGVSMYLTHEANLATFRQVARLAPGSTFASTHMLPLAQMEAEDQPGQRIAIEKTREAGTPFLSFYTPAEFVALGREAGFRRCEHFSASDLRSRYFAGRADGLVPASGEGFLVAET